MDIALDEPEPYLARVGFDLRGVLFNGALEEDEALVHEHATEVMEEGSIEEGSVEAGVTGEGVMEERVTHKLARVLNEKKHVAHLVVGLDADAGDV